MPVLLQVALGGALGASLRFLSGAMILRAMGSGFPYGTMFVNVVGSFLMGLLAFYLLERMDGSFSRYAPFLMTGLLGASMAGLVTVGEIIGLEKIWNKVRNCQ